MTRFYAIFLAIAVAKSCTFAGAAQLKRGEAPLPVNTRDANGGLTQAEKDAILKYHNDQRRSLGASSMEVMVWDSTIASAAQQYADGCNFVHSSSPYGENMYLGGAFVEVTEMVGSWWNENQWYTLSSNACNPPPGKSCGHYTQMAWGASNKVGCGLANCDASETSPGYLLVCNYSPAGNMNSLPPFSAGTACTNCANALRWCDTETPRGLCDASCTESTCDCAASCKNGGTLDAASCTCKCPSGYNDPSCGTVCTDHSYCGANPGWPSSWCTEGDYIAYIKTNCPIMCGTCG